MSTIKKAITYALAVTAASTAILSSNAIAKPNQEKCYGIVKAGRNDCQTAKASCAGAATKNRQGDAYLFLPKGVCSKIVGGSTKPLKTNR